MLFPAILRIGVLFRLHLRHCRNGDRLTRDRDPGPWKDENECNPRHKAEQEGDIRVSRDRGNEKTKRYEERKIRDRDSEQEKKSAPIRSSERYGEQKEEKQRQGHWNRQRYDKPE